MGENKMNKIRVLYHTDINKLEKLSIGDWIDLRAAEDVFIPKGQSALISLGVSMKLPEGYEAHVVPRSSTFKNYGLIMTNSVGIIDNSYCGTNDVWRFPAYCLESKTSRCINITDKGFIQYGSWVHKNDRICQFRIVKSQPPIEFVEVDTLDDTDRGGIGSTGVK